MAVRSLDGINIIYMYVERDSARQRTRGGVEGGGKTLPRMYVLSLNRRENGSWNGWGYMYILTLE